MLRNVHSSSRSSRSHVEWTRSPITRASSDRSGISVLAARISSSGSHPGSCGDLYSLWWRSQTSSGSSSVSVLPTKGSSHSSCSNSSTSNGPQLSLETQTMGFNCEGHVLKHKIASSSSSSSPATLSVANCRCEERQPDIRFGLAVEWWFWKYH